MYVSCKLRLPSTLSQLLIIWGSKERSSLQSRRMAEVGRNLWRLFSSAPFTWGHLSQNTQDCVQLGPEYLQELRLYNLCQCLNSLTVKRIFTAFCVFSLHSDQIFSNRTITKYFFMRKSILFTHSFKPCQDIQCLLHYA